MFYCWDSTHHYSFAQWILHKKERFICVLQLQLKVVGGKQQALLLTKHPFMPFWTYIFQSHSHNAKWLGSCSTQSPKYLAEEKNCHLAVSQSARMQICCLFLLSPSLNLWQGVREKMLTVKNWSKTFKYYLVYRRPVLLTLGDSSRSAFSHRLFLRENTNTKEVWYSW